MTKPLKIVVFDLDETLGYFTEFGIFCDCLNNYLKQNNYSGEHFNDLLDLYKFKCKNGPSLISKKGTKKKLRKFRKTIGFNKTKRSKKNK